MTLTALANYTMKEGDKKRREDWESPEFGSNRIASRLAKMKTLPEGMRCTKGYKFSSSPNTLCVCCRKGRSTWPAGLAGMNS